MNEQTNLDEKVSIKFADASAPQLRRFAKIHLGLPVSPNPHMSADKLRATIKAARPDLEADGATFELSRRELDDIERSIAPKPPKMPKQATAPAAPAKKTTSTEIPEEEKVHWIYIEREKGDQGNSRVEVACNGRAVLIPRGSASPISYGMFNSLRDAVEDVYDPKPEGGMEVEPRKVPRYPWRMASPMEIDRFKAANPNHPYVVSGRVPV